MKFILAVSLLMFIALQSNTVPAPKWSPCKRVHADKVLPRHCNPGPSNICPPVNLFYLTKGRQGLYACTATDRWEFIDAVFGDDK